MPRWFRRPRPAACPTASARHRAGRRAWTLVLPLALAVGLPPAHAGRDDDHDRARAAVQAGEVMPLLAVLERLKRSHPGQVLEVELERDDGRWVYEIKLLQPDGQLLKLALDARSGAVLRERRRDRERDRR